MGCRLVAVIIMHVYKYEIRIFIISKYSYMFRRHVANIRLDLERFKRNTE